MFNKQLKKQIKELQDEIKCLKNFRDLADILLQQEGIYYVDDYFKDCPCCNSFADRILFKDAMSFNKYEVIHSVCGGSYSKITYYTTKKSYELHKKAIDEWKKECDKYENKSK